MKKLFTLFILTIFSYHAFGQLKINPQFGQNYLWLNSSPEGFNKKGSTTGWLAGANIQIGKKYYFQTGGFYTTIQDEIPKYDDLNDIKNAKVSFFKVPVNMGVRAIKTGLLNLRLNGGFVINKLLKTDTPISEIQYNDWNYGFNFGGGIDILIFTLDANYEMGISQIYQNEKQSKGNMFTLTAGIKF